MTTTTADLPDRVPETLLLVDDDRHNRDVLKLVLERQGYRVIVAGNGPAALAALEVGAVDLVLSDIQMPGMDGLELLSEIRRRRPDAMVVMMTGHGSEEIAIEAMKRGANDYLVKPVRTVHLEAVLRESLEKHRLAVERQQLTERLEATSQHLAERLLALEQKNALLEASREELRLLHQRQRQLVSTISHELRTPMTVIKGALSLVLEADERLTSDKRAFLLERASAQSERVIGLISAFLDLERLDSGALELRFEPVDLRTVAGECVADLGGMAAAKEMMLRFVSALETAPLQADRDAVVRILTNLLSNAIKYAPAGSPIDVALEERMDGYRIAVEDRGPGIPEHLFEQVFDRFVRLQTGDKSTPSTGLGLAIVRSLAELHGGRAGVLNRPDGGACFWIELPREPPAPADVLFG